MPRFSIAGTFRIGSWVVAAALLAPAMAWAQGDEAREEMWVTNGNINAIAHTPTTVYLGGNFHHAGPYTGTAVSIDTTTGLVIGGHDKINGPVNASVPDGAGGWFVGGSFTAVGGVPRNGIAHLLPGGTLNTAWNPGVEGTVESMAISGSMLYVGGVFTAIGGQARNNIAALNAGTGSPTSWNPNANGIVHEITLSGPTVYVGGYFSQIGGQSRNNIAALEAATGDATGWNPNANHAVNAIAVDGDIVYVGGDFTQIGGQNRNRVAAVDANTTTITSWNPNASAPVTEITVSGSTVYVGGFFGTVGGSGRNRLAALNNTNGNATTWNPGVQHPPNNNANYPVVSIIVSGDTVFVAGAFRRTGGQERWGVAAINITSGSATAWNPMANGGVRTLALSGNTLFAGGVFTSMNVVSRNYAAAFDLATGEATGWNPDPNNVVLALAEANGTIYAGGNFTNIGGATRNGVAALNATTGAATSWNPNASSAVRSFSVSGNTLYTAGFFNQIGGQARNRLASFDLTTGDITGWAPNANAAVLTVLATDTVVYAGGYFTEIGGQPRSKIAALDPATGQATAWDPDANGDVQALALSASEDTVYAGGYFTEIGGAPRRYVAALDAGTGGATSWDPNPNERGFVQSLAVLSNSVIAGGAFSEIGGQPRNRVASLNAASGFASSWAPNPVGSSIPALALSDEFLFVGGNFTGLGLTGPSTFAVFDAEGPSALSIVPSITGPTNDSSIEFTVTFDRPVLNFNSVDDLTILHNGTAHTGASFSGGPEVFTVTITGVSGTGSFTVSVNSASNVVDLDGNGVISSVTSVPVLIDNTPPGVAVLAPAPTVGTSATEFVFTVLVDGALASTLNPSDVVLNRSGVSGGTVSVQNGASFSPTVRVSGLTGDGFFTVAIEGGIAVDIAGNFSLPSGPSPPATVANSLPAVTVGNPTPAVGNELAVFEFPVSALNASTFSLNLSHVVLDPSGVTIGPVSVLNGNTANPAIRVTGVKGDGSFTVAITGGAVRNALNQSNPPSAPSPPAMVDNTPPGISVSEPSVEFTSSGPVMYVVSYTGADTITLAATDIWLQTSGTAVANAAVSGNGNNTRTVTLFGITGEGSLGFTVAPGSAADAAGNLAPAAGSPLVVAVDNQPPPAPVILTDGGNGPGQNFATGAHTVVLTGTVGAGIHQMQLNGQPFSYTPNDAVWVVPVNILAHGQPANIAIVARDAFGNQSAPATITITYDPAAGGGDGGIGFPPAPPGTPAASIATLLALMMALMLLAYRRQRGRMSSRRPNGE